MATTVTNSVSQGGPTSPLAKQLGPSEQYIKQLFNQLVALNETPDYPEAATGIAQSQVQDYLNDLHPNSRYGTDSYFKCNPKALATLQADLQTIDRAEVAKRGGLSERWLIPMLARRHGMICQKEVLEVVNRAFQIEQECVYVDGFPAKNRVNLISKDPKAKIYTDAEVNDLRDLYFQAFQRKTVGPVLRTLVLNSHDIRQSTVKDIADAVLKIINQ